MLDQCGAAILLAVKKAGPSHAGGFHPNWGRNYVEFKCLVCEDKFKSKNMDTPSFAICSDCKRVILSFKTILVEEKKLT
jgi:CRISPR/Cas system endoribonuclease Cas6 (RAMP superfamily)